MTWLTIATALWFGILTSISPCPLATNIAAISFVARKVGKIRTVLLSGLLYAAGRTVAYLVLGALIMAGLLASGQIALFLQRYLNQLLGPVLILVGMLLLGLLQSAASLSLVGNGMQARAAKGGIGWAALLGIMFALSFCPVSAGLFFGVLIPLSTVHESIVILPLVYGIGTAAPVIVFALLIAFASQRLGSAFNRLTRIERWVRRITGLIFVLAGIYYSLLYVYELRPSCGNLKQTSHASQPKKTYLSRFHGRCVGNRGRGDPVEGAVPGLGRPGPGGDRRSRRYRENNFCPSPGANFGLRCRAGLGRL